MPISFDKKSLQLHNAKRAVAMYVWEQFIIKDDNPRVIIDAGSSAEAVAAVITEQIALHSLEEREFVVPTVFTHNLGAWRVLSDSKDKIDVYLVGGRYNPHLNAIIEPTVFQDQIAAWSPNIAVIAVSGVDEQGLYCSNIQDERPVKQALAEKKVERRLILCDHSKIGRTDVRMFVDLEHITQDCPEVFLITDEYDWKDVTPAYRQPAYRATLDAFEQTLGKDKVICVPVSKSTRRDEPASSKLAANGSPRKSGDSSTKLHRR